MMTMTTERVKPGEAVDITQRHCSAKLQPWPLVGTRHIVMATDTLKDGTQVILLPHPTKKGHLYRVNARRFGWRRVTGEMIREEGRRRRERNGAAMVQREFTQEEQMHIAVVPLMMYHIVWHYALMAVDSAAWYRISGLKQTARQVRELRDQYRSATRMELRSLSLDAIERHAEDLMVELHNDLTILYFSAERELMRKHPGCDYADMRCYAVMAILLAQAAEEHTRRMDALVEGRTGGKGQPIYSPQMRRLSTLMQAIAGDILQGYDLAERDLTLCRDIYLKRIDALEFTFNE